MLFCGYSNASIYVKSKRNVACNAEATSIIREFLCFWLDETAASSKKPMNSWFHWEQHSSQAWTSKKASLKLTSYYWKHSKIFSHKVTNWFTRTVSWCSSVQSAWPVKEKHREATENLPYHLNLNSTGVTWKTCDYSWGSDMASDGSDHGMCCMFADRSFEVFLR